MSKMSYPWQILRATTFCNYFSICSLEFFQNLDYSNNPDILLSICKDKDGKKFKMDLLLGISILAIFSKSLLGLEIGDSWFYIIGLIWAFMYQLKIGERMFIILEICPGYHSPTIPMLYIFCKLWLGDRKGWKISLSG